jgi:hypothetical protein
MKSSDFTLVLQQQLDVANETNRVLLARIDDLGKTIEELRTELAIANLKREELMSTITSMQEALLEKDADVNKQKRINKGLSKLVSNKSEKHKPSVMTSSEVENKTMPSSSPTKSAYAPKERGNNGVKRKEYFDIETVMEELYPTDKDFNPVLARFMKFRDSISYEYIPGKFIKRIRRQYFYSQNGTVYSGHGKRIQIYLLKPMKVQDGYKPVWKGRQYHNSYGQVPERKSTGCFLIVQTWCREYLFSSLVFIISIQECTQFYDGAFLHMNALPVRTANSHSSEHIRAGPTIGPELNHDHGRLPGNLRIEACCLLQLSDANLHKSHPA